MRRRALLALVVAAAVAAVAAALAREAEAPIGLPIALPGPASPTPSPTPAVADLGFECRAGAAAGASTVFETCTGSVRVVGPATVYALDVWVDSLDASGRAFFSCRAAVADGAKGGSTVSWRTVCEAQPGAAAHRVRFTDRAATPIPTATASR